MDAQTLVAPAKLAWNIPKQNKNPPASLRAILQQERQEAKKRHEDDEIKEIIAKIEREEQGIVPKQKIVSDLMLESVLNRFNMKEPNCIIPYFLFLSSALGASDYYLLEALDVQYVVVAAHGLPQRFGNAIKYLPLPIEDWIGEDILSHFDESIEFIEEARMKGKAVLVHCAAGISRSASICIAYVMKHTKCTYEEARKEIAQRRPIIQPNEAFQRQLKIYERFGCEFSSKMEEFVLWKLECIAKRGKETLGLALSGMDPKISIRQDHVRTLMETTQASMLSKFKTNMFCCSNCERWLFTKLHIHQARSSNDQYAIDRISWMKTPEKFGDLKCPQCQNVIGNYDWNRQWEKKEGLAVEEPFFSIEKSKLKEIEVTLENYLPKSVK